MEETLTTNILRKTKLIATIGPACEDPTTLRELFLNGVNVARLNLSHGSQDDHVALVKRIRKVAGDGDFNVAIMADTKGIEIRTGMVAGGAVVLSQGSEFVLTETAVEGNESEVSVVHPGLSKRLSLGDEVLLDDGKIALRVDRLAAGQVHCIVECGGTLRNRKSVSFPGIDLVRSAFGPDVEGDLDFAIDNKVEYIAASFVQSKVDVEKIRGYLMNRNADIPIIAKIENRGAVNALEGIIKAADGAMVARGDLGVELPVQEVPELQKRIIRVTVSNGKPVVTATQMLDSMERNPRPTRAEASDVANAIFDGTSAVMLSGETAAGSYPIDAVKMIDAIARRAELAIDEFGTLQNIEVNPANVVTDSVAQAAHAMSNHLGAAAIIAVTETGFTARMISKYRPRCPILAVTGSDSVVRKLAMNWGVYAVKADGTDEERVQIALQHALKMNLAAPEDIVVATGGISHRSGATNMIRVVTV